MFYTADVEWSDFIYFIKYTTVLASNACRNASAFMKV